MSFPFGFEPTRIARGFPEAARGLDESRSFCVGCAWSTIPGVDSYLHPSKVDDSQTTGGQRLASELRPSRAYSLFENRRGAGSAELRSQAFSRVSPGRSEDSPPVSCLRRTRARGP